MNNEIIALFLLCYNNKWGQDKPHMEFDNQKFNGIIKIKS